MSKYIIDVGDAYVRHALGRKLIIPVIINNDIEYWVNTNIQLTPYTEPDTEKVREEAYEQGKMDAYIEDSKNITMLKKEAEEAYQRGAEDMRKALRLLIDCDDDCLTIPDIFKAFGEGSYHAVVRKHPAMEIIEKIQAYEQEQEQIQVGDEVAFHHDDGRPDTVVVVTYIGQDGFIDGMDGRGTQYAHKNPKKWTKTGRHFHELVELLRKMKEES